MSEPAPVFGVVLETYTQPATGWGRVVIRCSNGTVIDKWMAGANFPAGQLVLVRQEGQEVVLTSLVTGRPEENQESTDPEGVSITPEEKVRWFRETCVRRLCVGFSFSS